MPDVDSADIPTTDLVSPGATPPSSLGNTMARGGIATVIANAAAQCVRVGAMILTARLLIPAEFGLFAMVSSAIGIASVLRDLGLSSATIQRPTITNRQLSTLFWINSGFGLLATLIVVAISPWLATGLGAPESAGLIASLAPTFLMGGLATQHRALLSRKLAFITQAHMSFWSMLASQSLILLLAWQGAGIWALVSGALTLEFITLIWSWRAESWRPTLAFSLDETRPLLVFGGYVSVFSILCYLASNLHQVLIGITSGHEAAGYFNRAYALMLVPISLILVPVGGVVSSALSRVQSNPSSFSYYYLNSVATVNLISAPMGCYALLFAPELVTLLLGPTWAESGVLFRLMAISLIVQPLMNSTSWVYRALGEARRLFWWGNVSWTLILIMYLPGLLWGARGVAVAHSLSLMLLLWPCLHFAFRGTLITTSNTLRICAPAACAAALAVLPAWGAHASLSGMRMLPALIFSSMVYAGCYIGLLLLLGEKSRLLNLWRHMHSWMKTSS